jgi:peptidoglycan/xylan/chitin deacetylase (PgdA/CDA1 family)
MRRILLSLLLLCPALAIASEHPVELHQRLDLSEVPGQNVVALTLDACSGTFDADLARFLIDHRIPATIFATRRWLERNPGATAILIAHPDLFDIEDHGANHVPAVIGVGRRVYGIAGNPDVVHLRQEVSQGAQAVEQATGSKPRWYRGATALYDPQAVGDIEAMGYRIAGFSVNADAGATLSASEVAARVRAARSGDILIAHMNRPRSATAEGLAQGLSELQARGYRFVLLRDESVVAYPIPPRRLRHFAPLLSSSAQA